jgi:hypothetical protein
MYCHKCAYLYFFDNTIVHWSMLVRQFLRNLQMLGAFTAAFTIEKREMTIKKSIFGHWSLIQNFFIAYLPILVRCKTKGAVREVCVLLRIWPFKVLTNEKRGGLSVVSFDRSPFKLFSLKFSNNWCRPQPVRGLKLLREPCFYHLQTIIVSSNAIQYCRAATTFSHHTLN